MRVYTDLNLALLSAGYQNYPVSYLAEDPRLRTFIKLRAMDIEYAGAHAYDGATFFATKSGHVLEYLKGEPWVRPFLSMACTNMELPNIAGLIEEIPEIAAYISAMFPDCDGLEIEGVIADRVPDDRGYNHHNIIADVSQGVPQWMASLTAKRRYKVKQALAAVAPFRVDFSDPSPELLKQALGVLKERWGDEAYSMNALNLLYPLATGNYIWLTVWDGNRPLFVASCYVNNDMVTFNSFVSLSDALPGEGTAALALLVQATADRGISLFNSTASTNPDYDHDEPSYVYKHSVCNADLYAKTGKSIVTVYGDLPGCKMRLPCYDAARKEWVR